MGELIINHTTKRLLLGLLLFLSFLSACGTQQGELSVTLTADKLSGTAPLGVTFTATPAGVAQSNITYSWDFGTGETVAGAPSQTHTFEQAGTFLVTVTARQSGQTAQASVRMDVSAPPVTPDPTNVPPTVTLSAPKTTGRAPLEVTFSAAATDPNGDTLAYSWDFGDGKTVTGGAAQTHTFTGAGTYTAVVTVADGRGGVTQAKTQITVTEADPQLPPADPVDPTDPPKPPRPPENKAPDVSLSANPAEGSAPLTVSLRADARDPEGEPLTYTWDFGNGDTAKGNSSRTLSYTEPGSYTAFVTVSDGLAETSAKTQIQVDAPAPTPPGNRPPENVSVAADPPTGTTPLDAEFSASADDPDGDTLVYLWDFGDGVISNENPARHLYQKAGTYNASVTVGDRKGGKAHEEVTVIVTGGGADTPEVPFYGEWAWTAKNSQKTFTGYLSISKSVSKEDSGIEEFFIRGGQGAWTYCQDGPDACGAPNGVGRINVLNYGDGDTFDIVFTDAQTGTDTGTDTLVAFDTDDRISSRDGAPLFEGEATWYEEGGSSDDLSFTLVKVADEPQTALDAALATFKTP